MQNEYVKELFNDDCVSGSQRIVAGSVNLMICDPPFGINESEFNKHYKRDSDNVIDGYQEAPKDKGYDQWTLEWMTKAKELLSDNGSFYIISGHTNLRHILNAAAELGLDLVNHIIWKFNFGVNTKNKFVTSHYHILYYRKAANTTVVFNTHCRFGSQEKSAKGGSLLYQDMEDVFVINKDYSPNEAKNQNKLPEELIKKLILYSSNEGDLICDFFMGNFTTAYAALKMGRKVCGFELNKSTYDYHIAKLCNVVFGEDLANMKKVENINPSNQGKPVSEEEAFAICKDYEDMVEQQKMKKKDASVALQDKYGRGRFSIKNILDKYLQQYDQRTT
jgi:site-specific DNA-methyltransferase (adenine-specific)